MQYIDSKMMKHLEDGGTILLDGRITFGLEEVRNSLFNGSKVWTYKKEPKYTYRRTKIYTDGVEVDTYWYPSKTTFMNIHHVSDVKFGPWQRRLATEVCDD